MFEIPDTDKKIRAKISSYKSAFNRELKEYGLISDGYGKRYLMFPLLLVLNDGKKSQEYINWHDSQFPDDAGEPIQMLCRSLINYRLGSLEQARYELAETMLSNVYLLPWLTGEDIAIYDMWHTSNFAMIEHCEYIPERVIESITGEELGWIGACYNSDRFFKVRTRYIEIFAALNQASDPKERSNLLDESYGLLEGFEKFN
ncbi:hypothetical protein F0249_19600 [Vibrio sp. 03-59-1]|uniref:hypothetical protein n=1 Tax=Vibrio sp. 03-59-1 TaxID=2607607 RepID=UPI00149337AC|nr:hypothetical protein [Vibrio sp. 03-59-1]NOH85986.1 hypothetical protein [Vibrio sp. 03-59-1]